MVAGVDGSAGGDAALRWAVDAGRRQDKPVTALFAWSFLDERYIDPSYRFEPGYSEDDARRALDGFVTRVLEPAQAALIHQQVACNTPVTALVDASRSASLVVVGARGGGGFEGLLFGSTADRALQRSTAPVAVIRGDAGASGPVIVGVDGSPTGDDALRWAVAEARARKCPLEVIHVWDRPAILAHIYMDDAPIFDKYEAAAEAELDEVLQRVDTDGAELRRRVVCGGVAHQLLAAASRASVVVVGSRGLGSVAGIALGSVSRQVVHHAPCPVVVVPPSG